jgi:hypothetical protein
MAAFAGLPVLAYARIAGQSIFHRRWRPLAWLAGLTAVASVAVGAFWLWSEMRGMPAIERYTWSGWYMVLVPGAYVVGSLVLLRDVSGFKKWLPRRKAAIASART